MDHELIRWCAPATRAACSRMTPQHLRALQDSAGQARCLWRLSRGSQPRGIAV